MNTYLRSGRSGLNRVRAARLLLVALTLASLAGALLPVSVQASRPLRSGTIVSGTGETGGSPWVRGLEGCVGAPTCSAWLQSGCAPALAGVDPALHASIVHVADLADGITRRSLEKPGGAHGAPLLVQFWTSSDEYDVIDEPAGLDGQGCEELVSDRVNKYDCYWSDATCKFTIPAEAHFMTVSSRPDILHTSWALT